MKKVVTEGEGYREKYNLAFDTEETEVYERVGKSEVFVVRMSEPEARMLKSEIEHQLEEQE